MKNQILIFPKKIALFAIRVYQFLFSFDHSFWSKYVPYRVCIYEPSCSEYTYVAVDRFGMFKGSWLGFKRILRCNGFMPGGYDPVPEK